MPESPEVESIRQYIKQVTGQTITGVTARDSMVFEGELAPDSVSELVQGHVIEGIERYGKYLGLVFNHGNLIYSLRMTGKVILSEYCDIDEQHVKLKFDFQNVNKSLHFTSVRRLSRLYWFEGEDVTEQENIARLGPDPLGDDFTLERFSRCFKGRTGPVKTILMDQGFVAGVGNIYANEVCFLTGIDPRRPADELTDSEKQRLHETLPRLLKEATEKGGSSFTNFIGGDGTPGEFQNHHTVYDREGEPCDSCGKPIQKITLSNRSTYFCGQCQH